MATTAMATSKILLRPPNSLPFFFFTLFSKPHSLSKNSSLYSLSPLSSSQPLIPDHQHLPYGPSLLKGAFTATPETPSRTVQNQLHDGDDYPLDEESFARVFDIAALQVPAGDCFELESRLRGHLLNWPRVRNIARFPGDDVDDEVAELVGGRNKDGDSTVALNRRIYGKAEGDGEELSPVLRREAMARTFESRGFVNFRNLAKMTRVKRKRRKRREEEAGEEGKRRTGRNEFAVVEVVEYEGEEEDLKGLLGDEFRRRKWQGPTRLLLLDESCSTKCVEELPEAIKVFSSQVD